MTNKQPQQQYEIGMLGLGVMGRNLVLNMADHGCAAAGYDRDQTKKALATGHKKRGEIPSGPRMTPSKMVCAVRAATVGWKYDAVSIGYHRAVVHGRPIIEPRHLGSGWLGFDFNKAFGRPIKIVNDAAMQRPTNTSTNCWRTSTGHSIVCSRGASTSNCSTSSPASKR